MTIFLISVDFSAKQPDIGPNETSLGHSLNSIHISYYGRKSIGSTRVNTVEKSPISFQIKRWFVFSRRRISTRTIDPFVFSVGLFRFDSSSCTSWLSAQRRSLQTTDLVSSSTGLSPLRTRDSR